MSDFSNTLPSAFGNPSVQTMSSREIAEVTDKEHKHVIRDIRVMLEALGDGPDLGHVHETKDSRGYTSEIHLDRDLTLNLVSGYNPVLRLRIIKRLSELEEATRSAMLALPKDFASALRALADSSEKVQALEARAQADAPKVAFAEQVEVAPDAISLGQAAKIFGTGRNRFCATLRQLRWITRTNEPYQDKIEAGYLDVKIGSWDHPEKGLQRSVTALVTGKGMAKLHKVIGKAA